MKKKKQRKIEVYDLPIYKGSTINVLGIDPGSSNMGISAVGFDKKKKKGVILANAVMMRPLKGLTGNVNSQLDQFIDELRMWITHFNIKAIVVERYQNRGIRGATAEEIGYMIGALFREFRHLKIKAITAATWKNKFHRRFVDHDLKVMYKQIRTPAHQLDATLIGMFGLEKAFGEIDYDPDKLMLGVEHTSLMRLINRKGR